MLNRASRASLYLSSYAPLFALLALRSYDRSCTLFWLSVALAVIALGALAVLMVMAGRRSKYEVTVLRVEHRTPDVAAYAASYLLPFLAIFDGSWRDVLALALFIVLIGVIYVSSGMVYVNPVLALIGYRLHLVRATTAAESDADEMPPQFVLSKDRWVRRGSVLPYARSCRTLCSRSRGITEMPSNQKSDQQRLADALSRATINLAFAWRKTPDDWAVEWLPIVDPLPERFREVALDAATDLHDNRTEVAYDPEWPLKPHEFFAVENARPDPPVGGNLFPQLDNFVHAPLYGASRRRSNPNLYVIIAQLPDQSVALFGRRVTARNVLSSKRWIRAVWTEETFSELRGPVVAFDPESDWIDWGGMVLVLNTAEFHATFRNLAELVAAVRGNVDAIAQHVPIINAAEMVDRCRANAGMASNLQSVVEQRLFEKAAQDLKDYAAKYPELGVQWSGDSLVFDGSLARQWSILKLFDEAGFTGDLSGEKFEAAAKRPL